MSLKEQVRDFFVSDDMKHFHRVFSTGQFPWAAALDGADRIVVASPDRDRFLVIDADGHDIILSETTDPMNLIDLESEALVELQRTESVERAMARLLEEAGIDELAVPKP